MKTNLSSKEKQKKEKLFGQVLVLMI